jgi:drug/metabolite transporter (DMT)-like permease
MALRHFSVYSLGLLRYIIASAILLVLAPMLGVRRPAFKDAPKFAFAGAIGFFLYMIVFNKGSAMETAATASIILATAPVITSLMSWAFFREKLSAIQWAAIAVEFSGILTLTLWNGVLSTGRGIPWLIAAACLLGTFNLQQRKLVKIYSGLQASIFSIFFGTAMLAVFAPSAFEEARQAEPVFLYYAAVLGIFSSALAYVTWSVAIERAPGASHVSNYMFLTPFVASLLGFLIAGEIPGMGTLTGGAIILFGVFLFNFGGRYFPGKDFPEPLG